MCLSYALAKLPRTSINRSDLIGRYGMIRMVQCPAYMHTYKIKFPGSDRTRQCRSIGMGKVREYLPTYCIDHRYLRYLTELLTSKISRYLL
jgi:hypothetical protein